LYDHWRDNTLLHFSVYKMEREEDVPLDDEQKHYNAPVGDFGFLGEDNPPDACVYVAVGRYCCGLAIGRHARYRKKNK
jgi:hypothetical protein